MNGVMKVVDIGLFWPNFMEAQEATQSDRQRQRECRARRREKARLNNASQDVTKTPDSVTSCHEVSQPVTPYRTVPCSTVPNRTKSKSPRTRVNSYSVEFELFRNAYPKHRLGGKGQDWKSWKAAKAAGMTAEVAHEYLGYWLACPKTNSI